MNGMNLKTKLSNKYKFEIFRRSWIRTAWNDLFIALWTTKHINLAITRSQL